MARIASAKNLKKKNNDLYHKKHINFSSCMHVHTVKTDGVIVSILLTKDGLSHYRFVMESTQQLACIVTAQYYNNSLML